MRKIVLTFGLIAGAVLSAMMLVTLPLHDRIGNDAALLVGYTTMVAASLLIYFGVRRYRDTVGGGRVSFGRALVVGALIGAVSGACYTATWEAIYFGAGMGRDYIAKYQAAELEKTRAGGATAAQLEAKRAEMARFAEMYKNPVVNAAMTFLEPLPVTVVIALISAGVLSRRPKRRPGEMELAGVA
jgi:hypothetical protein